ncbi:MAG: N-acetylmuramoyl-L-alanine amidase, partial [Promicromonosporaceae bacterium]|nr:N-acetylmuramoyl-L-alanine amidase [Promicromonosporaceae bacterium]
MGTWLAQLLSIAVSMAMTAGMSASAVSAGPPGAVDFDSGPNFATVASQAVSDTAVPVKPTVTLVPLTAVLADGEIQLESPDIVDDDEGVIEADPFQTIAVTWPAELDEPEPLRMRVRDVDSEEWGEWITLEPDLTGPEDAFTGSGQTPRVGSESFYVGESDAVEIAPIVVTDDDDEQLVTASLVGVEVVLISSDLVEPATNPAQFAAYRGDGVAPLLALTGESGVWGAQNIAAQPAIITRAQWGAQTPHWKNGSACTMNSETELKGAVVHHTAGGNSYSTQAAAMQQIRNDQAYHISLNWCDLGYNFVVDKWGNIYEGRAGSINSPVIGAHAAGFNTGTVGISMLGNYDIVDTPAVMVDAVGQIAGWMLGRFGGVDPQSTISYYSASGSTKWKAGSTVRLPAISGHRDVGNTACPGSRGYPQMARI